MNKLSKLLSCTIAAAMSLSAIPSFAADSSPASGSPSSVAVINTNHITKVFQVSAYEEVLFHAIPVSADVIEVDNRKWAVPGDSTVHVSYKVKKVIPGASYFFVIREVDNPDWAELQTANGNSIRIRKVDGVYNCSTLNTPAYYPCSETFKSILGS